MRAFFIYTGRHTGKVFQRNKDFFCGPIIAGSRFWFYAGDIIPFYHFYTILPGRGSFKYYLTGGIIYSNISPRQ